MSVHFQCRCVPEVLCKLTFIKVYIKKQTDAVFKEQYTAGVPICIYHKMYHHMACTIVHVHLYICVCTQKTYDSGKQGFLII